MKKSQNNNIKNEKLQDRKVEKLGEYKIQILENQ